MSDDGFCECIEKALADNRCPRCEKKLVFVATGVVEPDLVKMQVPITLEKFDGHLKCTTCNLTIHEMCND